MDTIEEPSMEMPFRAGQYVALYKDQHMIFEGHVDRYVESTGLLEFEEKDAGLAKFEAMLDMCDGYTVLDS